MPEPIGDRRLLLLFNLFCGQSVRRTLLAWARLLYADDELFRHRCSEREKFTLSLSVHLLPQTLLNRLFESIFSIRAWFLIDKYMAVLYAVCSGGHVFFLNLYWLFYFIVNLVLFSWRLFIKTMFCFLFLRIVIAFFLHEDSAALRLWCL